MRKLIAAINMTLDEFCDHTAMIADEETHEHYNELLNAVYHYLKTSATELILNS